MQCTKPGSTGALKPCAGNCAMKSAGLVYICPKQLLSTVQPLIPETSSTNLWPQCGGAWLRADAQGWLQPTPDYFKAWLARPELELVPESCRAEQLLHRALMADPLRPVSSADISALQDDDVRGNYHHFIALRDGLLQAQTLQAWLLALWRGGNQGTPPLFIDHIVQAVLRQLLMADADEAATTTDAFTVRAAELLFRDQRVSLHEGRWLAGDRATLDLERETHGFGDLGRLLAQAQQPMRAAQMQVLQTSNSHTYWAEATRTARTGSAAVARHSFLLDLNHGIQHKLGHNLVFNLTQAHSGLQALAVVLQRWVQHLLGVEVKITPLEKIDDAHWAWHVGLDVESTALLNDLYADRPVDSARLQRLISLFRLDFADAGDMTPEVAGKPVYLGLMASPDGLLRVKAQNLLLNLPLARRN